MNEKASTPEAPKITLATLTTENLSDFTPQNDVEESIARLVQNGDPAIGFTVVDKRTITMKDHFHKETITHKRIIEDGEVVQRARKFQGYNWELTPTVSEVPSSPVVDQAEKADELELPFETEPVEQVNPAETTPASKESLSPIANALNKAASFFENRAIAKARTKALHAAEAAAFIAANEKQAKSVAAKTARQDKAFATYDENVAYSSDKAAKIDARLASYREMVIEDKVKDTFESAREKATSFVNRIGKASLKMIIKGFIVSDRLRNNTPNKPAVAKTEKAEKDAQTETFSEKVAIRRKKLAATAMKKAVSVRTSTLSTIEKAKIAWNADPEKDKLDSAA